MKFRRLALILLLALAACTPPAGGPTPPAPTPTSRGTTLASGSLIPQATRTPSPTTRPPATIRPTPSLTAAAPATLFPSATLDSDTTARHLRIFEQVWNTVDAEYVYADYHGVDWATVHDEFQARIAGGLSDTEFWQALIEMIERLDDDHSIFLTPDQAREEDQQLSGNLSYVGIGIYASIQEERQQAVVLYVFPGSPAEAAGLRAHDAILAVDGQPVIDADGGVHLDRLRGQPGTQTVVTARSPGAAPREVAVTRRRIGGSLEASGRLLNDGAPGRRIGYLMIPTLWDATIADSARRTLRELAADGPLDGLIIDMRINGGGTSENLLALLGLFTAGPQGEFVSRAETRPLDVAPEAIGNSQEVPIAILVGSDTQSYAEVFSGALREAGRARLVGQTTAGNIETIYGYDFEDGSRAWIARETYVPRSGRGWEATGLAPDVVVPGAWDEFTDQDDLQLQAAWELLTRPAE